MRISSVRVLNYKCFRDTGVIALSSGVNIIVGKNDAGKSAFIEALSLMTGANPHRSRATLPNAGDAIEPGSMVELTYEVTAEELLPVLSRQQEFAVPLAGDFTTTAARFRQALGAAGPLKTRWRNGELENAALVAYGSTDQPNYQHFGNNGFPTALDLTDRGTLPRPAQDYGFRIAPALRTRVYSFRAERMSVGACPVGANQELQNNAANLADVLNQISTRNPSRYERLMRHVRTIFPHVTRIAATVDSGNTVRIGVWTVDVDTEREDLAVPLSDSGTGIGQVLAMLYVVVTSRSPRVIVIDEPQSFLHPGAVRKLFEVFRSYPEHQYVVTTHMPTAMNPGPEDTVLLVRRDEATQQSLVERIDPLRAEGVRTFLSEVGARLGDVFGADAILWVEGKTEEVCFPELIRGVANAHLQGVQILGVVSTDELAARFATRVFDIYTRLSGQSSLLPPALAFVLDPEGRSDTERADIERASRGLVRWLPLRMYENYLIEPEVVCAVLAEEDSTAGEKATPDHVHSWLAAHATEPRYGKAGQDLAPHGTDEWRRDVHGARLLHDLFGTLTDQRIEYDKVKHGLKLTRLLVKNPTPALRELATQLADLLRTEAA